MLELWGPTTGNPLDLNPNAPNRAITLTSFRLPIVGDFAKAFFDPKERKSISCSLAYLEAANKVIRKMSLPIKFWPSQKSSPLAQTVTGRISVLWCSSVYRSIPRPCKIGDISITDTID